MGHAYCYPALAEVPSIGFVRARVQELLRQLVALEGDADSTVIVRAFMPEQETSVGEPRMIEADAEATWEGIEKVEFRYLLDGTCLGCSTHEFESERRDFATPGEDDPYWLAKPGATAITQRRISAIRSIPFGWRSCCADDSVPVVAVGCFLSVYVLADYTDAVTEIASKHRASFSLCEDPERIATHWTVKEMENTGLKRRTSAPHEAIEDSDAKHC